MRKALRILILEDRPADAELVTRELRTAGFEFVAKHVTTENEFLAELRNNAPQVILADYCLPGYDGLSALAAAQMQCPETPFIFVSGSLGEETATETLHLGATDYVLKDRLARLGPAVRRALRECEEVRKHQQTEQRVRELNLVLRATGAINALMVRERDPKRLLAEACKILVETRGYRLAWIGRVETGSKRVVPAASAGKDADYLDAATITWDETPTGQRPIGTAIRTGQLVVCQDIVTDPRLAPYWEVAKARGLASMAAMPMICGSRVLGVVAVYSEHPGAFHEEELGLLKELAADLAFALQSIEHEQERERAGDALRASEVRYRRLFESAKDGILILDAETGMIVDVNPYLAGLLNISHEAFVGKELWELGFFKDVVANRANFAELQQKEYIRYDDRALETADGRRVEVEFISNVYLVNHKKVIQCNIRDVSERKRAEHKLRESEEFKEAIFDSVASHIAVLDCAGVIVAVNSPWRRFARENPTSAGEPARNCGIGVNYLEVCRQCIGESMEGAMTAHDGIQAVLEGREPSFTLEYPCHSPNESRWFSLVATPLGKAGRGSVVSHTNITERKQLEEALLESSQLNQQIVASAQEGIIVYGRDLKYQVWNPFMEQMTGLPAKEVLGKHSRELFPFLRDAGVLTSIEKALAGELTPMTDFRFEGMPSGKSGWACHTNDPLRNAAGEIIGVMGIVRDITERKRAELRVAAFASLGRRLNVAKTAREASEIIVQVADELLGWDACLFDLYSAADNILSHLLSMDLIDGRRAQCKPVDPDGPPTKLSRRAIEEGGQLILRDPPYTVRPEDVPFGDTSRPSASILFVPIRHATEVVGVLSIQSYTPRAYDAYSLETLQALADHGGGALERLRTQEALDEREATFRSVWERSIDGMRLTDKEGRILAVNEAFCRLVKLPREKLEGQVLSVVYRGHGPTDGIGVYQHRFATGEIPPRNSPRVELWNSQEVDMEISNSFVELGRRGKMLLSIFRDATERKRAELRIEAFSKLGLRLSAAKTAREAAGIICETASDLLGWDACLFGLYSPSKGLLDHVLEVDTIDGRRVECSPGYEPPSLITRRAMETGGQLILKEKPGEMLPEGQPFGDSSRPSASIMYVPIRKGAEAVGVLSIQSYTPQAYDERSLETLQSLADHCGGALDRVRMTQAWQTTQDRLGHLLTQSPAVIYSLNTDGITTEPAWVSDNVERLLGYTVAECDGPEGLFSRLHPKDRQGVIDGLVQLFAKGHLTREFRVRHKNGEYRWVRDEQRLVGDASGALVEIVGSWVDITERKAIEEQLRQSQKMEAVGQLAGGVAHDFNNLLAVIRGNAELLLMTAGDLTADAHESLTQVVSASERAANLTRQLLAFSRKQVLQLQPLLLNEVIGNLTKMLNRIIGENIDLQCHYAALLPYVQADTSMMEQVILNLVVNARDAMPAGGLLRVATHQTRHDEEQARTHPGARAGDFVCLIVSDTGTGIAPEVLPHIFEPFFTTKEVGKGTGLGLATVYGIVQQHQGWIEVVSKIGKGTAFKVFLPVIPTPDRLEAAAQIGAAVPGGSETILLVEDDHSVRQTTRRVLESRGYKIREAASAQEASELWDSDAGEIALLLTDIVMPGKMSGRDLADRLWGQSPGLKVIFMSGYSADLVDKNPEFLHRSRSRFLQKPCAARTLLETVRRCLDDQKAS